jgi:peptidoglycan hydrolase-like protein with peptidoglycan-binding domain
VHRHLARDEPWAQSLTRSRAHRGTAAALSVATILAIGGAALAGVAALEASSPEPAVAAVVKSRGGDVRKLQRAIGVPTDGVFGPHTERALKRWQRSHGLVADGIAGPSTRAALGIGSGPVLKPRGGGSHRARRSGHRSGGGGVRALQRKIGVPADGVFGPGTEAALKRWQAAHGLVPDGVAGPQTRAKLGLGSGPMLKPRGSDEGGAVPSALGGVISAANKIAYMPYRYGGGHRSFRDSAYDCSGSVSYALHGGGLLRQPVDSTGFMHYGAPGRGSHITIYANPSHVYMVVDGRRFDTTARHLNGSRWTTKPRSSARFVARHPPGL